MIEEIFSLALNNGLWAALFCLLFLYQLRDGRAREKKYVLTIDSLSSNLSVVQSIDRKCDNISSSLVEVKGECVDIRRGLKEIRRAKAEKKEDRVELQG